MGEHAFLIADAVICPWIDSPDQLTADAIEGMAAWAFWRHDERNMVMLTGEDDG